MNLIIKEYLTLQKESKELDVLLPDLLLTMNFNILSKPQIGVRQYGVDLVAFGKDEDKIEKLFLFVIKQGDITRINWNGDEDAVRASIDEILDVYIPSMIPAKYKNKKIKIVLCTGGDINQSVEINWNSYVKKYTTNQIEFDFWGGDKLAPLIYKNMFNENIFTEKNRSLLRKTLSLLADPSYNMQDYYAIVQNILEQNKNITLKKQTKLLRTLYLMMNIIFYWANNEKNLRPAILASEHTLLFCWKFIIDNKLESNIEILEQYLKIYNSCIVIFNSYILKFSNLYEKKNGLSGYTRSGDSRIETIMLFEHLGILSVGALLNHNFYEIKKDAKLLESYNTITNFISNFLENHPCLYNPIFDEQIIDIDLAMFVLSLSNKEKIMTTYLKNLFFHLVFAYNSGFDFFVYTNSFDDVLNENIKNRKELTTSSTLLLHIGFWISYINNTELYNKYYNLVNKKFSHTTIQSWYPDEESEKYFYSTNAGRYSGYSSVFQKIPKKIDEMQEKMKLKPNKLMQVTEFSCCKIGLPSILFLSNRHFRTPFISEFIIRYNNTEQENE